MHLTKPHSVSRFLWFVALSCSICIVGCSGSSKTATQKPLVEPSPDEFDQLELKVNDKDALHGKVVLTVGKRFHVSGQFRFVKPYKKRVPFGSIVIYLRRAGKGKQPVSQAGVSNLKLGGNRRATFSCDVAELRRAGEYLLSVNGSRKIIMQTKVFVEE